MNTLKTIVLLFTLLCFVAACKKAGPSAADEAKKFCDCSSSAVEMVKKMDGASPDEKEKMIKEAQAATSEALKCLTSQASAKRALSADKLAAWETSYKAAVKSTCPEAVKALKLNY